MMVFLFAVDKKNKTSNNIEKWKGTKKYPFYQLGIYDRISEKEFILISGFPLDGEFSKFNFLCINDDLSIRNIVDGKDIIFRKFK